MKNEIEEQILFALGCRDGRPMTSLALQERVSEALRRDFSDVEFDVEYYATLSDLITGGFIELLSGETVSYRITDAGHKHFDSTYIAA